MPLLSSQVIREWGVVDPPAAKPSTREWQLTLYGAGAHPPTFDPSSGDDLFVGELLYVRNGSAASVTLTVTGIVGEGADIIVTIPPGEERIVGPIPQEKYFSHQLDGTPEPALPNDHWANCARVLCSPHAGVTLAALTLP